MWRCEDDVKSDDVKSENRKREIGSDAYQWYPQQPNAFDGSQFRQQQEGVDIGTAFGAYNL